MSTKTLYKQSNSGSGDIGLAHHDTSGDGNFAPQVGLLPKPVASSDTATAAANTAVSITLAAPGVGVSNVISGIFYSYSAAPTGATLTITDGGTTVYQQHITASGPGVIHFYYPKKFTANTATVVTLSAAGASVVGMLNLSKWTV